MNLRNHAAAWALVVLLVAPLAACGGARQGEDAAAAPVSSGTPIDTTVQPDAGSELDSLPNGATPPITPPAEASVDTPPQADAQRPGGQTSGAGGPKVSQVEYEGWRQYSVNCARCHGQDVLPNPVAANLLISLAPGGPIASEQAFVQVVSEGRPARGMPAFKNIMTQEQIRTVYAYVKGRAEKRIPAGRPARPSA